MAAILAATASREHGRDRHWQGPRYQSASCGFQNADVTPAKLQSGIVNRAKRLAGTTTPRHCSPRPESVSEPFPETVRRARHDSSDRHNSTGEILLRPQSRGY